MHYFNDYFQPLINWMHANPHWALLITFFISFGESLAIIGSIVPGSVTMTAIGILAGSGIMRIDMTLLAAALGAVGGDLASYALGYRFRNQLSDIWPFRLYPSWLSYGKSYFEKHGGKSVLIGRFIGPLRSIIPLIAGMMQMNRWHFLVVNVISAIGWSFLYVGPGILIGAASSGLSPESASRLFILVLTLLLSIWFLTLFIKWLFRHANTFLSTYLNRIWVTLTNQPSIGPFFKKLTPNHEKNVYPTAGLCLLFLLSFVLSCLMVAVLLQPPLNLTIDQPIALFFQSLRTQSFDSFFIVIQLCVNYFTLLIFMLSICVYSIYHRDWRTLSYWLSLNICSLLIVFVITILIEEPSINDLKFFYPAFALTYATSLFSFLTFYISTRYRTYFTMMVRIFLISLLFLSGIGTLYLSDNGLSDIVTAYLLGFTICLAHWILYRRCVPELNRSQLPILFSCLVLILTSLFWNIIHYQEAKLAHGNHLKQYVLTERAWWNQEKPLLPIYMSNRFGQPIGIFNIQFKGSIDVFEKALTDYGWQKQPISFLSSLIARAENKTFLAKLPLIAQRYQNSKPTLTMIYEQNTKYPLLVLRLWRSNYHLLNATQPIWLGSIGPNPMKNKRLKKTNPQQNSSKFFKHILAPLNQFERKMIHLKTITYSNQIPIILLLKTPGEQKEKPNE